MLQWTSLLLINPFTCLSFVLQYEQTYANSHEAILFRKFLHDKVQRYLLLRYLTIKQTSEPSSPVSFHEQNIEFWLEVQRYKVPVHDYILYNAVLVGHLIEIIVKLLL